MQRLFAIAHTAATAVTPSAFSKRANPSVTLGSAIAFVWAASTFLPLAPHALAQGKTAAGVVQDEVVVEMGLAFKRGDKKALAQALPKTAGHPLEPWAAYWELKARLDEAQPSEIQAFFRRYAGTYQEDRLRNDWLLLLGQRRDWTTFDAAHAEFRMRDDREVQCYNSLVEHVRLGKDTSAQVLGNWLGQRDADDGCALAAERLLDAKLIKASDIWRKARLAAEGNRQRAAVRAVGMVAPDSAGAVAEIFASPARYLSRKAIASTRASKELHVLAMIRMATHDEQAAAQQLERFAPQLSADERSVVWAVIGKQAALNLDAGAHTHFAKATDAGLSDDLLGWKVRAALRVGQWRTLLGSTEAMSAAGKADATWAYWRARALMALNPGALPLPIEAPATLSASASASAPSAVTGAVAATPTPKVGANSAGATPGEVARAEARRLLEAIASPRGFYEQLALEELGLRISAPARPDGPTTQERETARLNPGLNRALVAISLGLRTEGVREWNYSTNLATRGGMKERELLAAAQLACEREVWDRCINTSERTKETFDHAQRFPMPFRESVTQRSQGIGLDPAYVYGLIRQESRFIMDARSHVGASGLMQVMPATAKWTAKKIGLSQFKPGDINDRETNIAIGTGYLKLVLDDFQGSAPLAAAAYNAGPSRARAWRQGPVLEAAIWAENVPFNETRDYVKKVAANATLYAAVLTGQSQSLKARIGKVGPRDSAAAVENKELP